MTLYQFRISFIFSLRCCFKWTYKAYPKRAPLYFQTIAHMFPWEDDGNSPCITIRGPSFCIFYFRSCLYDLPFTTSLHHISLPLSQHSPCYYISHACAQTIDCIKTGTNTTQNRSSPTACHRPEFPRVIRLTQSNLYVIFLLRIHTQLAFKAWNRSLCYITQADTPK